MAFKKRPCEFQAITDAGGICFTFGREESPATATTDPHTPPPLPWTPPSPSAGIRKRGRVGPGPDDGAGGEVEAEAEIGEQSEFEAHVVFSPNTRCRECSYQLTQQIVKIRMGIAIGQSALDEGTSTGQRREPRRLIQYKSGVWGDEFSRDAAELIGQASAPGDSEAVAGLIGGFVLARRPAAHQPTMAAVIGRKHLQHQRGPRRDGGRKAGWLRLPIACGGATGWTKVFPRRRVGRRTTRAGCQA